MNLYSFTVTGRGTFPYDMLRHDQCWPTEESSEGSYGLEVARPYDQDRVVHLIGLSLPDRRRWNSFGWNAFNIKRSS